MHCVVSSYLDEIIVKNTFRSVVEFVENGNGIRKLLHPSKDRRIIMDSTKRALSFNDLLDKNGATKRSPLAHIYQ